MTERVFMVPAWLRIWHWINAGLFLVLIITGASLHFASAEGSLIDFANARWMHNTAGIALAVNYLLYLAGSLVSGNWRQYVPRGWDFLRRLLVQARFYGMGIFTGAPHPYPPSPKAKFNPLQLVTYLGVAWGALPLLILSGLLYLFPEYAPDQVMGFGGLWPIAVTHYVLGLFLTVFMIGHVYMATFGATLAADLRMMITGWHESHKETDDDESDR